MTTKSFLFDYEPVWRVHRRGSQHQLPQAVQSWTYEAGSLTQRLRSFYGNNITVEILFHQWRMPYVSESRLLQVPPHRHVLTREVVLQNKERPLLLARTIIPKDTINVAHRNLAHLGTRPLGEVIFSYPSLERLAMELTYVQPNTWNVHARQKAIINKPLWGRRTVYAIQGHALLVSEFFLPEVLEH